MLELAFYQDHLIEAKNSVECIQKDTHLLVSCFVNQNIDLLHFLNWWKKLKMASAEYFGERKNVFNNLL